MATEKRAKRLLRRGPDGTTQVYYIDVDTGLEVTDLTGYTFGGDTTSTKKEEPVTKAEKKETSQGGSSGGGGGGGGGGGNYSDTGPMDFLKKLFSLENKTLAPKITPKAAKPTPIVNNNPAAKPSITAPAQPSQPVKSTQSVFPEPTYDRFSFTPPAKQSIPRDARDDVTESGRSIQSGMGLENLMPREVNNMPAQLAGVDQSVRDLYGRVTDAFGSVGANSGFRTPEDNARVGGARNSQHMSGRAVDLATKDMDPVERQKLLAMAYDDPSVGGIGLYPSGSIHLDTRPKQDQPAMWGRSGSYTGGAPQELADIASMTPADRFGLYGAMTLPRENAPTPTARPGTDMRDKAVASSFMDPVKPSNSGFSLVGKEFTPAALAAAGYSPQPSLQERLDLSLTLAGELDLRSTDPSTPEGRREAANIIASIVNRQQSSKKLDTISDAVKEPSQYSTWNNERTQKTMFDNYNGDKGLYDGLVKDYFNGHLSNDFNPKTTHYYNPSIVNPAWGDQMKDVTNAGPHRTGFLDDGMYNPSVNNTNGANYNIKEARNRAARDVINDSVSKQSGFLSDANRIASTPPSIRPSQRSTGGSSSSGGPSTRPNNNFSTKPSSRPSSGPSSRPNNGSSGGSSAPSGPSTRPNNGSSVPSGPSSRPNNSRPSTPTRSTPSSSTRNDTSKSFGGPR